MKLSDVIGGPAPLPASCVDTFGPTKLDILRCIELSKSTYKPGTYAKQDLYHNVAIDLIKHYHARDPNLPLWDKSDIIA